MRLLLTLIGLGLGYMSFANEPSSSIYLKLQKLSSLKRVLYVAAHPDDENTRALAWLSLGEKAETAYFSLTRGDGGQNLIGKEMSDYLGVLRTQELLAARSYDKASQYFSRAVDFGYSKSAEESFSKWGKEELMADLVLMIRKFKPDVIITRFPPDKRGGHGHHTASAVLAIEAFAKAADADYLKDQVAMHGVWQAASVYWNTSYWWDDNIKTMAEGDPDYLIQDIGGYSTELGMSFNEIGTLARSQHKCQGFGGLIERGSRVEYFKHLAGQKLTGSFFEHKKEKWSDILNAKFEKDLNNLLGNFDFINPSSNVKPLIQLLNQLQTLPLSFFREQKIGACKELIKDCLGLNYELVGDDYSFIKGDSVKLHFNIINRSNLDLKLVKLGIGNEAPIVFDQPLKRDSLLKNEFKLILHNQISTPYWLKEAHGDIFTVNDLAHRLLAEDKPTVQGVMEVVVEGELIAFVVSGEYKWRDPAYGERRRPMISVPAYTVNFEEDLFLVKAKAKKIVRLKIHSFSDSLSDELKIVPPKGWNVEGGNPKIDLKRKNEETWINFTLVPNEKAQTGFLSVQNGKGETLYSYDEIAYDHIPTQFILKPANIRCAALNADIKAGKIAYIKGVADVVPQAIEQLGFQLDLYEVDDLANVDLAQYQTVVLGIRIFNVHPELINFNDKLNEYVHNGGNVVMQYNTATSAVKKMSFGPKAFKIGRDRVTEEVAEVTFLKPKHPLLNYPNKISMIDFEGWVQERGLYFASEWDKSFKPLFSWADTGGEPVEGALIVTEYGKGQFIYTGISFFRELPNGVSGAYRLFANLLSYSHE